MKMDIYRVINEAKDSKIIDKDEMEKIYSLANDAILMRIAAAEDSKEEDTDVGKLAEIIIKNRDDYHFAKREDELDDFSKELNTEIKKKIKKDRKEVKKELFNKMDEIAKDYRSSELATTEENPNSVIFRLFLNEWNTKYAFTWKSFKEIKKNYEKTHILEGEDLFILKSLLEKDPNIAKKTGIDNRKADFAKGKIGKDISGKITDSTVFSKGNNTLTKGTIEKIKEKIAKTE